MATSTKTVKESKSEKKRGARTRDRSYANEYIFQGAGRDADSGLNCQSARWFDPSTGAWTGRDPGGFNMGDENLYRFVRNGPTNGTDSTGRDIDQRFVPNSNWTDTNFREAFESLEQIQRSGRPLSVSEVRFLNEIRRFRPPANYPFEEELKDYRQAANQLLQEQIDLALKYLANLKPAKKDPTLNANLAGLIQQLGSSKFIEREQASGQLKQYLAGQNAVAVLIYLASATQNPNPEIARRASRIIATAPNIPSGVPHVIGVLAGIHFP